MATLWLPTLQPLIPSSVWSKPRDCESESNELAIKEAAWADQVGLKKHKAKFKSPIYKVLI